MPQMSPINWLMMFTFTITIFSMINCINYFSFLYSPPQKKQMQKCKINWKW
uniref:ATP synthase complex subunit 8 n=1 Tax=Arescus labiatus TaxID=294769 RepID=U3L0B4_9CUCU|nr:ATP synthase F0 subunit 8 [Arescus labiatus]